MNNILDNLEKKYLNFKLGEEQKEALLSVFSLLKESGFQECAILGRAGTGKTTICQLIIHFIQDYLNVDYKLVTPTHKSKRVLSDVTKEQAITIHSLLQLKPNLDILDFNWNDIKFSESLSNSIPEKGIIIVDECSMINDDLYNALIKSCKEKKCKIIWQGDSRQLAPVKQDNIAKPFQCNNIFELSTVYRQKGTNPILDILEILRKRPIFDFKPVSSLNGSLILFDNWKALIKEKIGLFKDAINHQEPNEIKLLAYTNKTVEAFNKVIRFLVFNTQEEYVPGDFLMGYDNTSCRYSKLTYQVDNSNDFRVISAKKKEKTICDIKLNGWVLELYDYEHENIVKLYVLSENNNEEDLNELAFQIDDIRQTAILCPDPLLKKELWRTYYSSIESFVTPFDLCYNNRVIKKKAIDYGYAMTVHKSQASSYDNVIIDMDDIKTCKNKMELRQLQYVALSRTRNNIYMLI